MVSTGCPMVENGAFNGKWAKKKEKWLRGEKKKRDRETDSDCEQSEEIYEQEIKQRDTMLMSDYVYINTVI